MDSLFFPPRHPSTTRPAAPSVRRPASEAERQAAYRLRYDVYVSEQGKVCPEADHARRVLTDELDADADLIVAESEGTIVGTVRATHCAYAAVRERYGADFEIDDVPADSVTEFGVCSRLAVHPECRDMTVRRELFDAVYAAGIGRGIRLCFAMCAPALLRMFVRVGFREYAPTVMDPHLGLRHRILLVMDDLTHLQRVHSPFLAVAQRLEVVPRERAALMALINCFEANHAKR